MTTPENKSYRKNYAGTGINKNLLTPCRRIGLSRTKRTPKNICAIPQANLSHLTPEINKDDKNTTIVCEIECSTAGKQNKNEANIEKRSESKNPGKDDLTVKNKTKSQERKDVISKENNKGTKDAEIKSSKLLKESNRSVDHENSERSESKLKTVRTKAKKRKKLEFDSSDDSDSAQVSDKTNVDENGKRNCENNASGIILTKFTTEDYLQEFSANPSAFYDGNDRKDLDDFIVFSGKPEKLKKTSKSSEQMKKASESLKAEKKLKQLSASKENKLSETKSKCESDEEDDVFMASPHTDQQKNDLLKSIAIKEAEIRDKEDRLEQLKRARVYKTKHSPEKVAVHSATWLKGCRQALKDLLAKMQQHGSMDMESLVKNLRIPSEIVEKLNVL